jgi:hypothetical protein
MAVSSSLSFRSAPTDGPAMTTAAQGVAAHIRTRLMRELEEILDGIDLDRPRAIDSVFFNRIITGEAPPADDLSLLEARLVHENLRDYLYDTLPKGRHRRFAGRP